MAKNPSTRWYFNDWMTDLGVRQCSAAARGLWMEMLCLAAAADPVGHVLVGGQPATACSLAKHTGWDKRNVGRWLAELERNGVFSRSENGTIYNRRMVRERVSPKRKATPKGTPQEQSSKQVELFEDPTRKSAKNAPPLDSGCFAASQDSPSTSKPLPESPDAAREREGKEGQVEVEGNPEEARCARLGCSDDLRTCADPPIGSVQLEPDTPKTRMPARWADRHRDGECDALPSQAPASDCRPPPGEAATGGMVAAPFLPPNQRDLDPEGQNHDNPRQEPGMGSSHAVSPGLAASRPILGAVAMLGSGSCPRTRKSPALKAEIRAQWLFSLCNFGLRRLNEVAGGELITMCDIALRAGSRAATPPEITQTLDQLDKLRRQEMGAAA
jgi:hypothetical protein